MLKKLVNRPAALVMHIALLLIVSGAIVTSLSARKGVLHVRIGDAATSYSENKKGGLPLPFALRLDDFAVEYYPGTDTPSDYRSSVSVLIDGECVKSAQVSMNRILSYDGYRFYQTTYDSDELGSTFTVAHDPVGIGLVYAGYAVFLLAFLIFFFTDKKLRALVHKVTTTVAAIILFFAGTSEISAAENKAPKTLPKETAGQFGELYVFYHGRVCPLQTVAKDFRVKLYGNSDVYGLTDEQVLTGWMFYGTSWRTVPQKHRRGANDEQDRRQTVNSLFSGEFLKLYPIADSLGRVSWYAQNDRLPDDIPDDEWLFIRKSMNYIGELVIAGDDEGVSSALGKLKKFQEKQADGSLPSAFRLGAERLYNSFPPLFPVAGIYLLAGFVLLGWFVTCLARRREAGIRIRLAAVVLEAVLFTFLTIMLALVWIVGGHVPLSNGAETMMAIAWTVLLAGLVFGGRFSLMQPFALIISALALLVAAMGQANPAVTLLVPVLQSPLLSVHVSLMMLSYAVFAVIMVNSAAGLCVGAIERRHISSAQTVVQAPASAPMVMRPPTSSVSARLADISMLLLYFGVFFLAAGIISGSFWANVSWGCYWNWDPKETWALITLLIYAVAVHRSDISFLRKPAVFHIFLLLAFVSVLFTYFGVNFLLGGMHSYAG